MSPLTAVRTQRSLIDYQIEDSLAEARKERELYAQYSMARAVLTAANPKLHCFEREVHDDIVRRLPPGTPRRNGDFFVPTSLQRSGLAVKTSTAGAELVFTTGAGFIDALRRRAMVLTLGARMVTNLRNNFAFPRATSAGSASWVAENAGSDAGESAAAFDLVQAAPKTLTGTTSFSRQLLEQSTPAVDGIVENDFAQVSAIALDRAAIHGGGTLEPTGIYGTSGVNAVAMGGALTFAKVVDLESQVAITDGETDVDTPGYLTTPEIRARGKAIAELAGGSIRIWRDGRMNDQRAEATNQISKTMNVLASTGGTSHGIIYGVWSELIFAEWGVLQLLADPYRLKKQGMIEVTSFLLCNLIVRHPQSFAVGTGLTTA